MKYEYWFAALKGLANDKKAVVRESAESAKELYYIEETGWKQYPFLQPKDIAAILKSKKTWNVERKYEELQKKNVQFIPLWDASYPAVLREIYQPPYALYVKGKLPKETEISVAMVGARRCSPYGEGFSRIFAEEFGRRGIQVISGLARGIDGISQRGALNAGGRTYGIMGCGPDVCYPREHIGLYMDILENEGGIISEFPPGTAPHSFHFPMRNRLISALSDAVLVMEAKEKSGSLITADTALEQGRDVYALPGPVDSVLSRGCNLLIKQGAGILLSPEEFLEDLLIFCEKSRKILQQSEIVLESKENMVYSCLGLSPKNLDRLAAETGLPAAQLLNILISLELQGMIREVSKNYYVKET